MFTFDWQCPKVIAIFDARGDIVAEIDERHSDNPRSMAKMEKLAVAMVHGLNTCNTAVIEPGEG